MLREVNIAGLTLDPESNTPIIILKTTEENQTIPIWIGLLEATSIASALQKINFERPMTHDLFKTFVELQNIKVSMVEVCDLKDNTFFARIHFMGQDRKFSMDARPSDDIAIALRFQAPIYVEDEVINKSSQGRQDPSEVMDESEEGKKWAEYLEKLSPDKFGKV